MSDRWTDAWATALEEFPLGGTSRQLLRGLIQYGTLAPSSHNTQPWRFRLYEDLLELRVDQRRLLPVSDPLGREVRVACGILLGNMEIAARHFGVKLTIDPLPDPIDRDLIARITVAGTVEATELDHRLFAALPHRHTVRRPFEATPLPAGLRADLRELATAHGAWLEFVDDHADRIELAALIAKADRMQFSDPEFRRELSQWIRPHHPTPSRDGMPGYALGLGPATSMLAPMVIRTFEMVEGRAANAEEILAGSPALVVLGTPQDKQLSWLQAGRALAPILLSATAHGVRASFLNQPLEVGVLRNQVRGLLDNEGVPQVILRFGFGPEGRPSPRRPLTEVLEHEVLRSPG
jgi:hypothetical protein